MADSLMPSARLQQLCQDQRERWHRGDKARVETYLDRYPELRSDENLLLDFICAEYSLRGIRASRRRSRSTSSASPSWRGS